GGLDELRRRAGAVAPRQREKRLPDRRRRIDLEPRDQPERERQLRRALRAAAQERTRRLEISIIEREPTGGVARVALDPVLGERSARMRHVPGPHPAPGNRARERRARPGREEPVVGGDETL